MRNLATTISAAVVILFQAIAPVVPNLVAAATPAQPAEAAGTSNYTLTLNTKTQTALNLQPKHGSFDNDVLAPLRAAQETRAKADAEAAAKKAAEAAAAAAVQTAAAKVVVSTPVNTNFSFSGGSISDAAIQALGMCESGMTANRNSGNGFYGAFQFSTGTWNSMGTGYARADLAPIDVQIQAVQKLLSRSSIYNQFPGCARKLAAQGLI
ncbi:transglycosylase family protein [Candidatus Saccharibacteria bacterium]|nr:transglycosylase family protein [Candidatus Saccharibacteria bacterium]